MLDLLVVENLRHCYDGERVLDIRGFSVREGEIFAIIGPNGSGKSTLLRIVDLLEKPMGGDIVYWDGTRLSRMNNAKRKELMGQMALVFQDPLLFRRSVASNLAYGLKARGIKGRLARQRIDDTLRLLDLKGFQDRYAPSLSGGEAQKVSLARALALRPKLLLLDEPFASLDSPTRKMLMREVSSLLRELKTTTIYVTHDHREALEMADRLAVLIKGEIQQVGTPVEVFRNPANQAVADFVGVETLVEGRITHVHDGQAEIEVASVVIEAVTDLAPDTRVLLMIHPEEVMLWREGEYRGSARNRLSGVISSIVPLGAMMKVVIDCGFSLVAYVTPSSLEEMGLDGGVEVQAIFKATAVHLIPH
jgi:tungstate transport system ATP-binding protein